MTTANSSRYASRAPAQAKTGQPKTKQFETFGRKVTATATHLLSGWNGRKPLPERPRRNPPQAPPAVGAAIPLLPRPDLATGALPIDHFQERDTAQGARDGSSGEMLETIPQGTSTYSLFQGFQATLPDDESSPTKRHHRRGRKLLKDGEEGPLAMVDLKNERRALAHRLEMHGIRKNMCSSEIREIDNKIANLHTMREIVLDRLATLEQGRDEHRGGHGGLGQQDRRPPGGPQRCWRTNLYIHSTRLDKKKAASCQNPCTKSYRHRREEENHTDGYPCRSSTNTFSPGRS